MTTTTTCTSSSSSSSYSPHLSPSDFPIDPDITYLNHGAFGICPTPILKRRIEELEHVERQPMVYHMKYLPQTTESVKSIVAEFVGAEGPHHVSFFQNASSGLLDIIENIPLSANSVVIFTNFTYHSVRDLIRYRCEVSGATAVCVNIQLPIQTTHDVIHALQSTLEDISNHYSSQSEISFAVLDHITSKPALLLPIHSLVNICRKFGVKCIIVDGAHAVGQIHSLEVKEIDADFYVGNFHKWCLAPKSIAFVACKSLLSNDQMNEKKNNKLCNSRRSGSMHRCQMGSASSSF